MDEATYQKTYSMYREVLWIDPYFHFAVLEGAANLGWNVNRLGEAQDLLEAAMHVDPSPLCATSFITRPWPTRKDGCRPQPGPECPQGRGAAP